MFTYSNANTPFGQSERAYYLSYFIKRDRAILPRRFYYFHHFSKLFTKTTLLLLLIRAVTSITTLKLVPKQGKLRVSVGTCYKIIQ